MRVTFEHAHNHKTKTIVSDADLAVDVDRAGDVAEVEGEEGADVDEQEAPAASTATPAEAARERTAIERAHLAQHHGTVQRGRVAARRGGQRLRLQPAALHLRRRRRRRQQRALENTANKNHTNRSKNVDYLRVCFCYFRCTT